MSFLLYADSIPITKKISVKIPTVGEIIENEEEYYEAVTAVTATPSDMMVQLDDMGIDFTQISEFELFCMLFSSLHGKNTHLLFGELDLSDFKLAANSQNETVVLRDETEDINIDKSVHHKISNALRQINFIEKAVKRPANEEAKKFLIERARIKQNRAKPHQSQLEELIVAMVNTGQFPYNFETVKSISIYQFNASIRQIVKKDNYDNIMTGCYAGTVNIKDIHPRQLNWLSNK